MFYGYWYVFKECLECEFVNIIMNLFNIIYDIYSVYDIVVNRFFIYWGYEIFVSKIFIDIVICVWKCFILLVFVSYVWFYVSFLCMFYI